MMLLFKSLFCGLVMSFYLSFPVVLQCVFLKFIDVIPFVFSFPVVLQCWFLKFIYEFYRYDSRLCFNCGFSFFPPFQNSALICHFKVLLKSFREDLKPCAFSKRTLTMSAVPNVSKVDVDDMVDQQLVTKLQALDISSESHPNGTRSVGVGVTLGEERVSSFGPPGSVLRVPEDSALMQPRQLTPPALRQPQLGLECPVAPPSPIRPPCVNAPTAALAQEAAVVAGCKTKRGKRGSGINKKKAVVEEPQRIPTQHLSGDHPHASPQQQQELQQQQHPSHAVPTPSPTLEVRSAPVARKRDLSMDSSSSSMDSKKPSVAVGDFLQADRPQDPTSLQAALRLNITPHNPTAKKERKRLFNWLRASTTPDERRERQYLMDQLYVHHQRDIQQQLQHQQQRDISPQPSMFYVPPESLSPGWRSVEDPEQRVPSGSAAAKASSFPPLEQRAARERIARPEWNVQPHQSHPQQQQHRQVFVSSATEPLPPRSSSSVAPSSRQSSRPSSVPSRKEEEKRLRLLKPFVEQPPPTFVRNDVPTALLVDASPPLVVNTMSRERRQVTEAAMAMANPPFESRLLMGPLVDDVRAEPLSPSLSLQRVVVKVTREEDGEEEEQEVYELVEEEEEAASCAFSDFDPVAPLQPAVFGGPRVDEPFMNRRDSDLLRDLVVTVKDLKRESDERKKEEEMKRVEMEVEEEEYGLAGVSSSTRQLETESDDSEEDSDE